MRKPGRNVRTGKNALTQSDAAAELARLHENATRELTKGGMNLVEFFDAIRALEEWDLTRELDEMLWAERNLLLFFETCVVDEAGAIDQRRMNKEDFVLARAWVEIGFLVSFERVRASDVLRNRTYRVELSEKAWALAHAERRARYKRMEAKRTWQTVSEKNAERESPGETPGRDTPSAL